MLNVKTLRDALEGADDNAEIVVKTLDGDFFNLDGAVASAYSGHFVLEEMDEIYDVEEDEPESDEDDEQTEL